MKGIIMQDNLKPTCLLILLCLVSTLFAGCASTAPVKEAVIDRISAEQLSAMTQPAPPTKTLQDIANMQKMGATDTQVIDEIKTSQSRYALTPSEVIYWHSQGISQAVLDYMQQANQLAVQNQLADTMNQRAKERASAEAELKRQRDDARLRAFHPYGFYGPGWMGPIGPSPWGWRHPYWGNRFGWGMGMGW
jgi:hypothetical protein